MNNPGRNNDISTFMNEKRNSRGSTVYMVFVCVIQDYGRVTGQFLARFSRIEVGCGEPSLLFVVDLPITIDCE